MVLNLRKLPMFTHFSDEELSEVQAKAVLRKYSKGSIIFMEGDVGDALYFVETGKVKLYKTLADGREQILHFVQTGDIFAEVLLFGGGTFPATAQVIESSTIGVISNQHIDELLVKHPQSMLKVLKYMAMRLRKAQGQIRDLSRKDTQAKLISTLLKLEEEFGQDYKDCRRIGLALTQQDLANMIGTSRESVARIISELKRQSLIKMDKQYICLVDKETLQDRILDW